MDDDILMIGDQNLSQVPHWYNSENNIFQAPSWRNLTKPRSIGLVLQFFILFYLLIYFIPHDRKRSQKVFWFQDLCCRRHKPVRTPVGLIILPQVRPIDLWPSKKWTNRNDIGPKVEKVEKGPPLPFYLYFLFSLFPSLHPFFFHSLTHHASIPSYSIPFPFSQTIDDFTRWWRPMWHDVRARYREFVQLDTQLLVHEQKFF